MCTFFYIQTSLSLFLSSISAMPLPQINCHFFFPSIWAMPLPQTNCNSFFPPPILAMPLPQIHCHIFFPLFRQCHCHKPIATIFFPSYFGNAIATNPFHKFFFFFEKWYVHTIFTTNPKWQVVTGYYCWIKKVISVLNSNLN